MKTTNSKDYLGKNVTVKIDRALRSKHGFMYMLNYGFIPNTISADGEELDAYLVGVFEPVEIDNNKNILIYKNSLSTEQVMNMFDEIKKDYNFNYPLHYVNEYKSLLKFKKN